MLGRPVGKTSYLLPFAFWLVYCLFACLLPSLILDQQQMARAYMQYISALPATTTPTTAKLAETGADQDKGSETLTVAQLALKRNKNYQLLEDIFGEALLPVRAGAGNVPAL